MPSLFEPAPFALWQLFALAVIVVCASGASVYLIRKHVAADSDGLPDAVFWDVFAGLAIVAPAVILPALAAPWAGLLLGVLAVAAAAASYFWTPRVFSRQAGPSGLPGHCGQQRGGRGPAPQRPGQMAALRTGPRAQHRLPRHE